jgi:hypothetical protein
MATFALGDNVRIKARKDWPTPPGYRFAKAEGTVDRWVSFDEAMKEFGDFVFVRIDKAQGEGKEYIGNKLFFRAENLEKID